MKNTMDLRLIDGIHICMCVCVCVGICSVSECDCFQAADVNATFDLLLNSRIINCVSVHIFTL